MGLLTATDKYLPPPRIVARSTACGTSTLQPGQEGEQVILGLDETGHSVLILLQSMCQYTCTYMYVLLVNCIKTYLLFLR